MTPDDFDDKLAEIEACNDAIVDAVERMDDEVAHIEEDKARHIALKWIAEHATDERAREIAKLALVSEDLEFARWCA